MDKRFEENLRVKNSIIEAFVCLLKEKPIEEISVSEITTKAAVSRVSYYRNYKNKQDILTSSLQDLKSKLEACIMQTSAHTPVRRIMTSFFSCARNHAATFLLLHEAGMDMELMRMLDELFIQSSQFPTLNQKRDYATCIFTGALFRLLLHWYETEMAEKDVEISNLFCQYMDTIL